MKKDGEAAISTILLVMLFFGACMGAMAIGVVLSDRALQGSCGGAGEALAAAMEKFLSRHLGGRFQEDVPTKVAQRLEEITVDVASVEAPAADVAIAD